MMKGRNLVILLGIPTWLFLIWKGDIYYALFILLCMVLALGEFYTLMEKKGNKPLRWMGMASTVFIAASACSSRVTASSNHPFA